MPHQTRIGRILIAAIAAIASGPALAKNIQFYQKTNCNFWNPQDVLALNSGTRGDYNCTYGGYCKNDAYKSVEILAGVAPGTVIRVWDDSHGRGPDDWAEITVKQIKSGSICVGSFEANYENSQVKLFYHRRDNLNGKVSLIQIRPPN